MMKLPQIPQFKSFLMVCFSIFIFSSCTSRKEIVYFQNMESGKEENTVQRYKTTLQPDDLLVITVSAIDMDAVRPFNLITAGYSPNNNTVVGNPKNQAYLIATDGTINFPVIGTLKLGGLSKTEAIALLKEKIEVYVKDPIINIEMVNFKISVLGEVKQPGTFTIPNERITIMEALGLAGDLNITGKRNNVLIIRDTNGIKTYTRVDLTKKELFSSPFYYLQQNDVVYIEPNKARINSADYNPNTGVYLTLASILISLVSILSR